MMDLQMILSNLESTELFIKDFGQKKPKPKVNILQKSNPR